MDKLEIDENIIQEEPGVKKIKVDEQGRKEKVEDEANTSASLQDRTLSAACFLNKQGDLIIGFKNHIFFIDHTKGQIQLSYALCTGMIIGLLNDILVEKVLILREQCGLKASFFQRDLQLFSREKIHVLYMYSVCLARILLREQICIHIHATCYWCAYIEFDKNKHHL